jgi:hypothetical protein
MDKLDLKRFRGDTDPLTINIGKNGKPVDLTGSTFKFSVSATPDPTAAIYLLQLTGVTIPLDGVVHFTPTALEADLVGNYFYDIQMTTGIIDKTIANGKIKFVQDITK